MSLLGIKDYFTVSVVLYVVMLLSNIAAFPLIEVAGRRPLLLYGIIGLTAVELVRVHLTLEEDMANPHSADGHHGLYNNIWCTLGDFGLHFPLVRVTLSTTSQDANQPPGH